MKILHVFEVLKMYNELLEQKRNVVDTFRKVLNCNDENEINVIRIAMKKREQYYAVSVLLGKYLELKEKLFKIEQMEVINNETSKL